MTETAHALGASRTLWELIDRRAALTPDRTALIQDDGRRLAFGELRDRCERVAAGLCAMGVRPGTVVAWQLPTRIETVLLSGALARIGAVQSPIIPFYRDREVGFALRESNAEFFAVPGTWRGFDHGEMARRLGARGVFDAYASLPDGDPAVLPPPPDGGTSPAEGPGGGAGGGLGGGPGGGASVRWIYWTSGTTSDPKGVLHTDRSLIAGGSCLAHALRLTPDDVGSIAFPFAHIGGADYLVMLLLYGFPAVLFEKFALPDALETYRRHGVTTAGGSTAFYAMLLAEQRRRPGEPVVPSLRLLAGGGAAKPPELYHAIVREMGVQLTHGYGMTEVPMITMGDPDDTPENLATTEGRPPEGMEIRIVDGEVRLRGEAVCRGYLDPAQSAAVFDPDGFLITGDLGHLTESGHLVLTGRLKDVIIRKGENISAKEIEDLLHEHPAVGEAAVIGLPDPERGERVCAVLTPRPGAGAPPGLADVTAYLREAGLAVHKLPEQVEVMEALPRNEALRKVLKYKLRERFGMVGGG